MEADQGADEQTRGAVVIYILYLRLMKLTRGLMEADQGGSCYIYIYYT